ncbi:MAG TPA: gluconokinase [Pyrinomonadaceae bacterium]|nr:gluconokinase [Pyrinomonadaceae bacterium]
MENNLILGLDIGSSSVRAALYDMEGGMVPETLVKNERSLSATGDGGSEIDAEIALRQVVATIDDVMRKPLARKGRIEFVAQSAFWHSLVGVDSKGKPTTKVLSWADTRSRDYVPLLRKRFDENAMHSRTGARFHSSFWPAKLLWLRKESPDAFARTDLWLSFSDFVALRLFGIAATSLSMASGSGLLDIRTAEWNSKLAAFLAVRPGALPLVSRGSYTFYLSDKFAKRWPRLRESQWFPAIADGAANNIGVGCVKRTRAALMIGTSGAMRVAFRGEPPPKLPPGLWCYRIDEARVIIGGALSDGGGLYAWLKQTFSLTDDKDSEIWKREPDSHGLTFMPFLAGERSTGYHENARGAVVGLSASTDVTDIARAALESVAFRFAEIFEQLTEVSRPRELIASGGAVESSPAWTQMIADVLGRDLVVPKAGETSMRGAVLLALETTGRIKKIEDVPTPDGKVFKADRSRKAIYAAARKRHQETYRLLIDRERS